MVLVLQTLNIVFPLYISTGGHNDFKFRHLQYLQQFLIYLAAVVPLRHISQEREQQTRWQMAGSLTHVGYRILRL